MTGGPALRFCFAFLQATARAWIPQKPIYKYTHIPITRLPLPDTPESAWTQHGCTQTSRQRAGCSHTQHWATHGRPRQSQLRRSTAACRHRVTHTHTSPSLGYAQPDTPESAWTQHGRTQTSRPRAGCSHTQHWATHGRPRQSQLRRSTAACRHRVTHTHPHITIGRTRPDAPESARTQHGRTQTSRPRAGCSHTQHWATHGRPRQSQLRRSTAACRHRVTHTHTSPSLGYAQPDTPESAWTQHGRTQTSRPRAGCSHTQHWATHGRPRQSQLRRSTAACRHRVTHTHIPTSL